MLELKYIIYGILFYVNFALGSHLDVIVNDSKHVLNQTNYQDITSIYGYQQKIYLHRPSETPYYFICYTDKLEGGEYTFFIFNKEKKDVLVAVAVSSLSLRATEMTECHTTEKKLSFKINQHQLGEINPNSTDKINYQKENLLVAKPLFNIKEKFNYFKNSLIKYEVYLSEPD